MNYKWKQDDYEEKHSTNITNSLILHITTEVKQQWQQDILDAITTKGKDKKNYGAS